MATLPSHAGRGAAKSLVSWIFPYADAAQLPIFLIASPVGSVMYRKLGFEEIGDHAVVRIDLSEHGGQGIHRHVGMVRYPIG